MIPAGTWVQIETVVLAAGERAPQVPTDTQATPLMMWAKGWLVSDASLGDEVEVETVTGRRLSGRLMDTQPGYHHTFGAPIAALQRAGEQARRLLAGEVNRRG